MRAAAVAAIVLGPTGRRSLRATERAAWRSFEISNCANRQHACGCLELLLLCHATCVADNPVEWRSLPHAAAEGLRRIRLPNAYARAVGLFLSVSIAGGFFGGCRPFDAAYGRGDDDGASSASDSLFRSASPPILRGVSDVVLAWLSTLLRPGTAISPSSRPSSGCFDSGSRFQAALFCRPILLNGTAPESLPADRPFPGCLSLVYAGLSAFRSFLRHRW